MDTRLKEALDVVLENWDQMQYSRMENAQEDADRFEASFYQFIEVLGNWFEQLAPKPETLQKALEIPEINHILNLLPAPLYINFETELELIIEKINS